MKKGYKKMKSAWLEGFCISGMKRKDKKWRWLKNKSDIYKLGGLFDCFEDSAPFISEEYVGLFWKNQGAYLKLFPGCWLFSWINLAKKL